MGNKSVAQADEANVYCETFGPGMFVNLLYTPRDGAKPELNLLNDTKEDHLLQVKTSYDGNGCVLYLNSTLDGGWLHQEKPNYFPPDKGKETQLTVKAETEFFGIYANKKWCHSYQYRDDVRKLKCVEYHGNGTVTAMSVGMHLPGFTDIKVVYIQARAPEDGTFAIDFVSTFPPNYKLDNIPLHMSVRFNDDMVVRGAKIDGAWKEEEREGGMPFIRDEDFSVTVFAQKESFEIGVNGEHFTTFKYRTRFVTDMSVQLRNVPTIHRIECY